MTNGNGDYATENYTYSSTTGNLASKAGVSYTYSAQVTCPAGSRTLAHAVSTAGSKTFTYDCNGNMTGRNVGSSYNLTYDAENRLTSVSGAVTASYVYDGDGKRVRNVNAYQNLAGGAPASSDTSLYNPDVVTNGDTWADSGSGPDREFAYTGAGLHYAQLDLGAVYSVDKVKVWHYAYDGRTYHNTKTQVSEDGTSWYTVFESTPQTEYPETAAGKTHTFTARNVRYVRDWLNGSTANVYNHWVEIEVWGTATIAYIGNYFEWTGSANTMAKYYYAGSQRAALRRGSTLNYLFGDHLGSTSLTADNVTGRKLTELRYKPWGENRFSTGSTPTTFRFTGQRSEESSIGLYYYGARWYDPYLNRWTQPDTIVPGLGEGDNPNAVGYCGTSTYSQLVIDYHENQFLIQLNDENRNRIQNPDWKQPPVPTDSTAFDRYAFSLNNPLKYVDPTGHDPTLPPNVEDFLNQLQQQVSVIWRNVPGWAQSLFSKGGHRIIMVDNPHLGADYWHLNTDLKPLLWLDHKNIETLVTNLIAFKTAIESVATAASNAGLQLLERVPVPFFFWPSELPVDVIPPKA